MIRWIWVIALGLVTVGPVQSCAFLSADRCRRHRLLLDDKRNGDCFDSLVSNCRLISGGTALNNDLHSSGLLEDDQSPSNDTRSILPRVQIYQKPRQIRRIPTKRKPRYYWQSTSNLRDELALFWEVHNVTVDKIKPPIPSEHLLNYFKRNDLRGAIASYGGRERVSNLLGGAKIIPGRWKDALEIEEVECLLPLMNDAGVEERILSQQSRAICTDLNMEYNAVNEQLRLVDLVQQTANHTSKDETTESKSEFWNKEKAVLKL
jgi:hypothetical protein